MPSRPACLVLGLGLGALTTPLWDLAARLLAGESIFYPKEP